MVLALTVAVTCAAVPCVLGLGTGSAVADDAASTSAFDHAFVDISGAPLPLSQHRGKVLLVVNTASFCGFTRQYQGLQTLWERYEARGLVVIGVPSNDFGWQEPGTNEEIKSFCQGAFGVTFPLTTKATVKGRDAHPFYRWAASQPGSIAAPRWNFHKYLIARDGSLIGGYGASVEPLAQPLVNAIETALSAPTG